MDRDEKGPGQRLRQARKDAGLSVAQVAKRLGKSETAVRAWENGQNGLSGDAAGQLAPVVKSTAEWILFGRGETRRRMIQVVGYVGAAAEFFGFDDHEKGAGLDEIEAPADAPEGAVAVIVRGDSGYPAIRDGMVLVYWNKMEDPSSIEGEDCFIRVRDGRTLVKILEYGSRPGRWTLRSINAATPPIKDVEIEWAAPIEIRLRRKNWKAA
jgi:transcriptional regulator with XRE-family HTH domain